MGSCPGGCDAEAVDRLVRSAVVHLHHGRDGRVVSWTARSARAAAGDARTARHTGAACHPGGACNLGTARVTVTGHAVVRTTGASRLSSAYIVAQPGASTVPGAVLAARTAVDRPRVSSRGRRAATRHLRLVCAADADRERRQGGAAPSGVACVSRGPGRSIQSEIRVGAVD